MTDTVTDRLVELQYASGGHGGPYKDSEADAAAKRLLRGNKNEQGIYVVDRATNRRLRTISRDDLSPVHSYGICVIHYRVDETNWRAVQDIMTCPNPERYPSSVERVIARAVALREHLATPDGDMLRQRLGIPLGTEFRVEPTHYRQLPED